MKLRFCLTLLLATVAGLSAFADKDPDEYHAQLILANGDTVTGYIHNDLKTGLKNMFSKTGPIRQYVNLGEQLDGGETKRYSAEEVREYTILNSTEGYPEGQVCVSALIHSPNLLKVLRYVRGFAWELNRRESGSILRWDTWQNNGGQNSVTRLVPVVGVKLKGAPGAFGIITNGRFDDRFLKYYLKKNYPALKKAWEDYYDKGKDAKAHRKEAIDNPSTFLLFYENFLLENPPLDDDSEE